MRLVDEPAQRADVVEDGAGAAIDLGDPPQRVLRGFERLLGDAAVFGGGEAVEALTQRGELVAGGETVEPLAQRRRGRRGLAGA